MAKLRNLLVAARIQELHTEAHIHRIQIRGEANQNRPVHLEAITRMQALQGMVVRIHRVPLVTTIQVHLGHPD